MSQTRKPVKPFTPPFFGKFAKNSKDLFKKKFDFEHTLKTINKSRTGLTIESGAVLAEPQAVRGYVKAVYPVPSYGEAGVEVFTDAAQTSTANFRFTKLASGLTVNTLVNSRDKDRSFKRPVGGIEIEYAQEYVSATVTAKSDLDVHKVDASATIGSDGISVGGTVSADVSKGAEVNEVNYGAEYIQDDYVCSIYTEKNAAFVSTAYYQKISAAHALGAIFRYEIAGKNERTLSVGSEYRVDADTLVKAKIELPTGDVSTHIEHRLANPRLLFGVACNFNLKSTSFQAQKLGVGITLGDF